MLSLTWSVGATFNKEFHGQFDEFIKKAAETYKK